MLPVASQATLLQSSLASPPATGLPKASSGGGAKHPAFSSLLDGANSEPPSPRESSSQPPASPKPLQSSQPRTAEAAALDPEPAPLAPTESADAQAADDTGTDETEMPAPVVVVEFPDSDTGAVLDGDAGEVEATSESPLAAAVEVAIAAQPVADTAVSIETVVLIPETQPTVPVPAEVQPTLPLATPPEEAPIRSGPPLPSGPPLYSNPPVPSNAAPPSNPLSTTQAGASELQPTPPSMMGPQTLIRPQAPQAADANTSEQSITPAQTASVAIGIEHAAPETQTRAMPTAPQDRIPMTPMERASMVPAEGQPMAPEGPTTTTPPVPDERPRPQPASHTSTPSGHTSAEPAAPNVGSQIADLVHTIRAQPDAVPPTGLQAPRDFGQLVAATAHAITRGNPQPDSVPVPLEGIAVEIAARAQAGRHRFEIRLDPPELGRIEVRLDIDRSGQVTSRLIVERAETLDVLRRDAHELERAFQQAGLKTGDNGLQFALRDQGSAGRGEGDSSQAETVSALADAEAAPPDPVAAEYSRVLYARGGVDIRV